MDNQEDFPTEDIAFMWAVLKRLIIPQLERDRELKKERE